MKYAEIQGVKNPVSRLVFGSMALDLTSEDASFALLDAAFERGYTAIDTAHCYGGGATDRMLGKWMAARGNRQQVVILAKGCHHNADRKRVTPFDLTADLHDSLARFGSDYVDMYMLHRDDPSVAVGPIVERLNEHLREGKILSFGGSNWSHQRIEQANEYAAKNGLVGFAASSPNFSLAWQMHEPWPDCLTVSGPDNAGARQWYCDTQLPLMAYSSLARGFMTGRITRENFEQIKPELEDCCVHAYCHGPNFDRLERATKLASEMGVTIATIAMAYVMNQPMNIFALVAPVNEAELDGNVAALDVQLTADQLSWLENG